MNSLKPLLYFSIFKHPLKLEEIHSFSTNTSIEQTVKEVNCAIADGIITKKEDFYLSNEVSSNCITNRVEENKFAQQVMQKAIRRANFIHKYFPFVRGVGISGSLSKGRFNPNADVDYFIITSENSLWTCRTLLVAFKKLFLLNSKKFFCVNYFITENALEIEEKNRFTATELVTLIPVTNHTLFNNFYAYNQWVHDFFPNKKLDAHQLNSPSSLLKKVLENLFRPQTKFSEHFFKSITTKFWSKKFSNLSNQEKKIAFKSSKDISKHHPDNYQKKVIDELNKKYHYYNQKFKIKLQKEYA